MVQNHCVISPSGQWLEKPRETRLVSPRERVFKRERSREQEAPKVGGSDWGRLPAWSLSGMEG